MNAKPLPSTWIAAFRALSAEPPMPLELFDWAVTRQSNMGPGLTTCAKAWGITPQEVRDIVAKWSDKRGHMEVQKINGHRNAYRIDAYYNTSGG